MRRHATAFSARSKARKPSGQGSSSSGRLRLTILLATAAAFLLVPAAQAAASGVFKIQVEGSGHGMVEGHTETFPGEVTTIYSCSGPPATGTCESPSYADVAGFLTATPGPGSEFTGWTANVGEGFTEEYAECEAEPVPGGGFPECIFFGNFVGENVTLTATFECETEGGCEEPAGPTNRRPLTVTKSAGGSGGIGTVSSKPKGINCATACDKAVASMYENQTVVLKGKAATGSTLSGWTGCESTTVISSIEGTCTVAMSEAQEVSAVFGGTSKAIVNPQALSLSKGESSGYGTVKAAGLACEAECSGVEVLYQGPVLSPKFKPGKTVELKETAAYGSSFTGWSGACSGSEPVCKVTMEEALSVTAEFTAKPKTTLTIEKNSYETGTGTVSSKPKGINCATACTTQTMSVPSGETIVLKGKAATGMTLTGWTGCESTTTVSAIEGTCTVSPTSATTVKATFSGLPKAIVNPKALTLTKAGSGFGTVKAAGLACEAECTTATVLFGGPVFSPKFKPGKTVLLKATSAPGSKTVTWSGCEEEPTPAECVVVMEADAEVTATFDELE